MRVLLGLGVVCLFLSCSSAPSQPQVRRITYWEKWTGFEGAAMQAVVDRFNERERHKGDENPSYIPIEVDMVTVSKLDQKLLVAVAGGNPPDVAGAWTWLVYSYSEKGALTDLAPFMARSALNADHYLPVFWDICQYDGSTWALPTTPASTALHWNKRLFAEAGLDPDRGPTTMAELERYAEQLTVWDIQQADGSTRQQRGWCSDVPSHRKRLRQVGFLPSEPNWWPWAWGFYFGGQLWDGQGRITATDPGNIRAMHWVRSWADKIGIEHLRAFQSGFGNFSSPNNPFMNGRIAMEIQGVWMYNFIDKYASGMEWGAGPFPHPDTEPQLAACSNVEADVLVIPRDSKDPEAAWAFIEFVSSQEGMELLCLGQRKFSPLKKVSKTFLQNHPHPRIDLFRAMASSPNRFSTPKMGIWNEYKRELAACFDAVLGGSLTPEVALQEVQTRLQASFDRNQAVKNLRVKQP